MVVWRWKIEGGGKKHKFLLIACTVKLGYEKCMGHQSGTQLFAWLKGLKQCVQASLTQALRMPKQYNTAEQRMAQCSKKTIKHRAG